MKLDGGGRRGGGGRGCGRRRGCGGGRRGGWARCALVNGAMVVVKGLLFKRTFRDVFAIVVQAVQSVAYTAVFVANNCAKGPSQILKLTYKYRLCRLTFY